ncbi:hypothetical protein K438DRAFT_1963657 [Mycena galopus ATCC 62051]|nr:hypothetical protein K438DRAFT_1963657 [Mycena galopus ATCC 62051]
MSHPAKLGEDCVYVVEDVLLARSASPVSHPLVCQDPHPRPHLVFVLVESRDGEAIIKRSWEKCVVPGKLQYNLSYECLTSRESRKALREYLKKDPTLTNEIKDRCGATHLDRLPLDLPNVPEDTLPESNLNGNDNHDDSDVPLVTVLRDALGAGLTALQTTLPVSTAAHDPESAGMSATNDEEDIWAFDDQGRKWADIEALQNDRVADGAEKEEEAVVRETEVEEEENEVDKA